VDIMYKNYRNSFCLVALLPLAWGLGVSQAGAQVVPTAIDGTVVNQTGNQFGIVGGQVSGDGTNLFHSFERFGLSQGQVADFLANPQVRNIFGRVVGGEASAIDGLLKVSGGSANLFLMNPSGILFGPNARLDIPAAFTATTANGIGFGGGWFSTTGVNDFTKLLGNPDALSFVMPQSGAIANFGQLAVGPGQSLSLVGGTVLNLGGLSAPGGNVTIAAVADGKVARISPVGSLLSVERSRRV
jgi:filamentous hemagglutinin family protein